MPNYKTHLVGGLVTFLCIVPATTSTSLLTSPSPEELFVYLCVCLLGSIFPDIDVKSKMQRLFYGAATLAIVLTLLSQAWTLFFIISFCAVIVAMLRHRTITHQIWFLIAIPGIIALYLSHLKSIDFNLIASIYLFFVGGALSHVILDKTLTAFKKLFKI